MAETGTAQGKKSTFGFLGKKIGPVPIWLIAVAIVAAYYWYENYGPGATKKQDALVAQQQAQLAADQQEITDLRSQKSGAPQEDQDNPKSGPAGPAGPPGPPGEPGPTGPPGRREHHNRGGSPPPRNPPPVIEPPGPRQPLGKGEPPPTIDRDVVPMTRWRAA